MEMNLHALVLRVGLFQCYQTGCRAGPAGSAPLLNAAAYPHLLNNAISYVF